MSVTYQFTVGGPGVNKDPLLLAQGVSYTQDTISLPTAFIIQAQAVSDPVFQFNSPTQSQYLPLVVGNFL